MHIIEDLNSYKRREVSNTHTHIHTSVACIWPLCDLNMTSMWPIYDPVDKYDDGTCIIEYVCNYNK